MKQFLSNRWFLILVLLVFVVLRVPYLGYSFYWDESWSYAPGVRLMYEHGPSLMPGCIDTEYSRGHPLLFYAAAASWMKIFGTSHMALHCFALLISVLLLISIYEACLRLMNKQVAAMALVMVASQVMFVVQSTMVLPEVMVALFALLAVYYYSIRRNWATFAALTALLLTKESGLALAVVLGVCAVAHLFDKEEKKADKIKGILPIAGSGVVIGLFFLVQHRVSGWYLFPGHTSRLQFRWDMFKGKMRFGLEILLVQQLRVVLMVLVLLLSALVAVIKKEWRYSILLLVGGVLWVILGEHFGYLTRKVMFPILFGLLYYWLRQAIALHGGVSAQARRFLYVSLWFFATYMSFSSINFFTNRYLLAALVAMMVLLAFYLEVLLQRLPKGLYWGVCVIAVAAGAIAYTQDRERGDVDPGAYTAMRVQEKVMGYLEDNKLYDQPIAAGSFMQREHMTKPMTGYLRGKQAFMHVTDRIDSLTKYVITDNIEPDSVAAPLRIDSSFKVVFSAVEDSVRSVVWGRR